MVNILSYFGIPQTPLAQLNTKALAPVARFWIKATRTDATRMDAYNKDGVARDVVIAVREDRFSQQQANVGGACWV